MPKIAFPRLARHRVDCYNKNEYRFDTAKAPLSTGQNRRADGGVIQNLYLLAPLPFMIAMPILYAFYKLDKIYPQVMAELKRQGKL